MCVFRGNANRSQNSSRKRNQHKCLTRREAGAHNQVVNMLPIGRKRAHPFTQTAVHNSDHVHQRDGDNPESRYRADRVRFTLRGFQQDPDNRKANQGTARIAHKDFIATP